jgi:biopolymer transport protein ExbD
MKLPARQKKATADWQLQLINIVFLLLLFFVMNGTISNIQDASIDIPRTVELATAGTVSEAAYVSAENRLTFRGAPATAEGIASAWLEEAAGNTRPFLVVADRKLPAVQLMARLQELKKAGILSISLVTIREAPDAQ